MWQGGVKGIDVRSLEMGLDNVGDAEAEEDNEQGEEKVKGEEEVSHALPIRSSGDKSNDIAD